VLCSWQFVPFKYSNKKVKFTLEQAVKAQMALDGDGWSTPRPGHFTSRIVTLYSLSNGRIRQENIVLGMMYAAYVASGVSV